MSSVNSKRPFVKYNAIILRINSMLELLKPVRKLLYSGINRGRKLPYYLYLYNIHVSFCYENLK
jgi:hypothetical protein